MATSIYHREAAAAAAFIRWVGTPAAHGGGQAKPQARQPHRQQPVEQPLRLVDRPVEVAEEEVARDYSLWVFEEEGEEDAHDGNVSGGTDRRQADARYGVPAHRRPDTASPVVGVSWSSKLKKWQASSKGQYLGVHASEEAAARAIDKHAADGVVPMLGRRVGRAARISNFKGVYWDKHSEKWRALYVAKVGRCRLTL